MFATFVYSQLYLAHNFQELFMPDVRFPKPHHRIDMILVKILLMQRSHLFVRSFCFVYVFIWSSVLVNCTVFTSAYNQLYLAHNFQDLFMSDARFPTQSPQNWKDYCPGCHRKILNSSMHFVKVVTALKRASLLNYVSTSVYNQLYFCCSHFFLISVCVCVCVCVCVRVCVCVLPTSVYTPPSNF